MKYWVYFYCVFLAGGLCFGGWRCVDRSRSGFWLGVGVGVLKKALIVLSCLVLILSSCNTKNKSFSNVLNGTLSIGSDFKYSNYFHLDNSQGKITGQYCYAGWLHDKGFDVKLEGEMRGDSIFLAGANENGSEKVSITGKVSNMTKDIRKIEGIWKNLITGEVLELYLQETLPECEYPFLPTRFEGYYKNSNDCNFELNIYKQEDKYTYKIQTGDRNFEGDVLFVREIDRMKGGKVPQRIIFKDVKISDKIYHNEITGWIVNDNIVINDTTFGFTACNEIVLKKE